MSLQVWLPLNGDTHNQGLLQLPNLSQNNFTQQTDGKIGKCYSGQGIYHLSDEFLGNSWSLCAWVKSSAWSQNNDIILCKNTTESTSCQFYFSIINGANLNLGINAGSTTVGFSYTFATNTWYHVAATYDGSKYVLYINGEQKKTGTCSNALLTGKNNLGINCRSINANGTANTGDSGKRLNDVRIYDHALSPKEVEEIAKGLVLHYKLDNYWLAENLLINTHFDNRYAQTTGWDTSKNGTLLANSWGGYNSGVANQATVYHAHLKEVNGEYVYEFIKDANNSWLGISQSGLQSKLTSGTKYTFSWEQYCVSGSNYVNTGLYYYKTGASSANFHLGYAYGNSGRVIGKWQKFTYTFTAPSDADYAKNMSWYVYGAQGGNGTFYARHFKLEKGDKATPWCPAKTDTLYTALGYNGTTIYDSSGYANNGTIVGSLTAAAPSPRYGTAIQYPDSACSIGIGNLSTMVPEGNFTFNIWFKKKTGEWSSKNWETILGGPSGFEFEGKLSSSTNAYIHPYSWGGGSTSSPNSYSIAYTLDEWHMVTMVRTTSATKFYLDGEWKVDGTAGSIPSGNYFIGAWKTATQQNYRGYFSDARIYATALTAAQIKELYNTSMSIDSNGNVYARELVEL